MEDHHGDRKIGKKGEAHVFSFARDQKAVIAHTSLNQSALDFQGNRDRIIKSIKRPRPLAAPTAPARRLRFRATAARITSWSLTLLTTAGKSSETF